LTTEEFKIIQGPDRLRLSVSLFYVGKHGSQEPVIFKTEPAWSPHTDEVEVEITGVEAIDRVFGSWKIKGHHATSNYHDVEIEYSTHNKSGKLKFLKR
jgi:hypothetical protein